MSERVEIDPFTGMPVVVRETKEIINDVRVTGGGADLSQYYTKTESNARYLQSQSYDVFIYNSSGSQSNNRFNDWSDLMDAIALQEGTKTIFFEQNETIPTGSWNLDYVTLRGNGNEYNAGGYTLTFGDNTTISSWLVPGFNSLRLLSTSTTGHICTFTYPFSLVMDTVTNIQSSSEYEFFSSSYSGQNIIALRNSARFQLISGSTKPLFRFTGTGQTVILSRGDGAVVQNNTFSSANSVTLVDIVGSANQALSNFPSTHSGATIGFTLPLYLTSALALGYDNTTSGMTATNVQDAIDELEARVEAIE